MPITRQHLEEATRLARRFGATRLILFGSALRNPATARDLDLAVGGIEGWALWKLAGRLERMLPVPIDVVPLEPPTTFTRRIEAEGEVLLGD